jgi:hypothetical protein
MSLGPKALLLSADTRYFLGVYLQEIYSAHHEMDTVFVGARSIPVFRVRAG